MLNESLLLYEILKHHVKKLLPINPYQSFQCVGLILHVVKNDNSFDSKLFLFLSIFAGSVASSIKSARLDVETSLNQFISFPPFMYRASS